MRFPLIGLSLFFVLTACAWSRPEKPAVFSIEEKGVAITVPGAGRFTLEGPVLMLTGGKDEKPSYSTDGDGTAKAVYASGMAAVYRAEAAGSRLAVRFTGAPAAAKSLKFAIMLPIKFNQGGRYAFESAGLAAIPPEPAGQFVGQGPGTRITLVDPLDYGFSLTTPWGFHQLQDNRVHGWGASYVYIFYADIQGKAEGEVTREQAMTWLAEALADLGAHAAQYGVPLLYEPLNRYETNLLNRQLDAAHFLESRQIPN